MTSAELVPVAEVTPVTVAVELVATEVEYLPRCGACGGPGERLKRLGGVGRPLCPGCYQRARRAAEGAFEELRAAALRASTSILYNELLGLGLAPRTIKQYQRTIWTADRWFNDHGWSLTRATPEQVAKYAATKPFTFASRNLIRSALTHYWAIARHPKPPVKSVRVPPKPAMVCRALDEDDARTLAAVARARGDLKGFAVLLGVYQGLRREEIATLTWEAFSDDGWLKVIGKGSKTRVIPLHPAVVEAAVAVRRPSEYVFPGRFGGAVCPATIWAWVRAVADEAGLGEVAPHVLRHLALATQNDRTGDLRTVQQFAGHSNPSTTAGYTRASKRKLQEAVRAIDY